MRVCGTFSLLKTGRNIELFYCLKLVNRKTFEELSEFLVCDGANGFGISWPLKTSVFQAFVKENKSISFPIECFHPVSSPATKEKQTVLEWIQLKVLLDNGGKPINGLAHVGITTSDIDLLRFRDHRTFCRAFRVFSINVADALLRISSVTVSKHITMSDVDS